MRLGSMLFPQTKTLATAPKPTLQDLSASATASVGKGLAAVNGTGVVKRKPGEFPITWPKMPVQKPKDYRPITTAKELIEYAKKCDLTGYASFDYETAPSDEERQRWAEFFKEYNKQLAQLSATLGAEQSLEKPDKALIKSLKADIAALESQYKERQKEYAEAPLDPWRSKITTVSIAAQPHEARVAYLDHKEGRLLFEPSLSRESARKLFMDILDRNIFGNPKITKIAYNLPFETKQSAHNGKYINMPVVDPFIMLIRCLQVVAPNKVQADERAYQGKSLKAMTKEYLGVVMTEFKKLLSKAQVEFFDEISTDDPDGLNYSAEDSDYALQLYFYWVEIAKQIPGYDFWLHNIEMPFMRVIGLMEYWGMSWDTELAEQKRQEAAAKQAEYQEEIKRLAMETFGVEVNPGAAGKTGDVRYLVFDLMKLPAASWSKKTNDPTLDKEAILDMIFMLENNIISLDEEEYLAVELPADWESRDPESDPYLGKDERQAIRIRRREPHPYKEQGIKLLKIMQKIQKYATLLSSHVDGREKYLHPVTKRIHHNYGVWTETSRCNCFRPNGQNVPRSDHDELGVRTMYKAEDGKRFFFIDFSGFELRIMAWKSGDEVMIDIFNHNGDMHKMTASKATGKPMDQITKHERYSAKPANFGICYGGTEYALQKTVKTELDMRWSLETCAKLVRAVKEAYPRIPEYQRNIVLDAREKGYVSTIYGYIRRLDHINSSNNFARGCDERRAGNTPVQGTAADIMKKSQNAVYDKLGTDSREFFLRIDDGKPEAEALEGLLLVHGHNDMVAQIHDEIVFQMDDDPKRIKAAADWIKSEMEKKPIEDFPVPVVAEAAIGYNWGSKTDYEKWLKQLG